MKNLSFTLDCHLTVNAHISKIARTCYFELRRLAFICRFMTSTASVTLVSAFVLSRIDYCNSLLFGSTQLVLSQVSSHLNSHNRYNTCQSAYRPGHRTETALLKVVNDLFPSVNKGNISVLALLDFSSAFDTIDHPILVHRLFVDS